MSQPKITIEIAIKDTGDAAFARMKARFAELADTSDKALREVKRNFNGQVSSVFASGGEREYLETVRRLQNELRGLLGQIPIIGHFFSAAANDALKFATGTSKASSEVKNLQSAYKTFQSVLSQVTRGKNPVVTDLFKDFGIDAEKGLRAPAQAFRQFISEFQRFPDPAGRARIASDVFGASAAKLLPTLESAESEMTALSSAGVEAGGAFAALAAPVLIAAGAVLAAVAATALLGVGLFKITSQASSYGEEIFKAAKQTGVTTENISTLKLALDEADVPLAKFTTGYAQFERQLAQAGRGYGGKGKSDIFKEIGVNAKEASRTQEGTWQAFLKTSQYIAQAGESANKFNLIQQVTGKGGKDLAQVMEVVGKDFEGVKKRADAVGLLIKPEQAQAFHEFEVASRRLHAAFTGLILLVGAPFVRAFTDMLEVCVHVFGSITATSRKATKDIGEHHTTMWGVIKTVLDVLTMGIASTALKVLFNLKSIIAGIETIPDAAKIMAVAVEIAMDAMVQMFKAGGEGAAGFIAAAAGQYGVAAAMFASASSDATAASSKLKNVYTASMDAINASYQKNRAALNFTTPAEASTRDLLDLPGKPGKKKHGETEDTILNRRLELIRVHEKEIEGVFQSGLEKEKGLYDTRKSSLQDFVAAENTLARVRLNDMLDALDSEKQIIQESGVALDKKAAMTAKVDEQIIRAQRDFDKFKHAADREQYDKEVATLMQHGEDVLRLKETQGNADIAKLRHAAEQRIVTSEYAEKRIGAIELAANSRELRFLKIQYEQAGANQELRQKVLDEIRQNGEQRNALEDEINRRTSDARRKDLDDARKNGKELLDLQLDNLQRALEIGKGHLDQQGLLGATPKAMRRGQAQLDVASENMLHRQRQAEILQAQASIGMAGKNAERRAQIDQIFRDRQLLEEARHSDVLTEIQERPLVAYRQKVEETAQRVGDVFARSFDSIFEEGQSFWKSLVDGFKGMLRDIISELIRSKIKELIMSAFFPKANSNSNAQAGGSAKGGIFDHLKSIFNSGSRDGYGSGEDSENSSIFHLGGSGGQGGIAQNFKQQGFLGGLKNMLGFGGAASSSAASSMAGGIGASSALPAAAGSWATAAGGAGALAGGAGAAGAGAGAAGAGGAAAGGSSGLGALVPFLTNPWTIGIAAAAVGGILLWKHFSHGTEKRLRDAVKSAYQVDIKDMKTLSEIKQIGESAFGKGQVSKHLQETVKLDQVKEIVEQYAATTGQNNRLADNKQLAEITDARNQFTRRALGGTVTAGTPYVVGDRGPRQYWEMFVPQSDGYVFPSIEDAGSAATRATERVRARIVQTASAPVASARTASSGSSSVGSDAELKALIARLGAALEENNQVMGTFRTASPGDVVERGLGQKPRSAMNAVNKSLKGGHGKEELQKGVGL